MIAAIFKFYAFVTGKNHEQTPVDVLHEQLNEKRPLPLGLAEFHEWSDRIISGAMITATPESQKYTLSNLILHMKPTEDYCEDAYFIKSLRKLAANQVADYYRQKIFPEVKARLAAAEESKTKQGEVTPPAVTNDKEADVQTIH